MCVWCGEGHEDYELMESVCVYFTIDQRTVFKVRGRRERWCLIKIFSMCAE